MSYLYITFLKNILFNNESNQLLTLHISLSNLNHSGSAILNCLTNGNMEISKRLSLLLNK